MPVHYICTNAQVTHTHTHTHTKDLHFIDNNVKFSILDKQVIANDDLLPEALEIREKLKNGFPRVPFNILFVGSPGAGKSSLINRYLGSVETNYERCLFSNLIDLIGIIV